MLVLAVRRIKTGNQAVVIDALCVGDGRIRHRIEDSELTVRINETWDGVGCIVRELSDDGPIIVDSEGGLGRRCCRGAPAAEIVRTVPSSRNA